jgi:uncharacterized protein involved in response to NO
MFRHPLWLVGFRPLFTLALVSGVIYPLVWALVFAGHLQLPAAMSATQWHAHEMLFGFGWAVLGGFLLTASKNWVGVRGMHGGPLALAAALWLFERAAVLWPAQGAAASVRALLLHAFGAYVFGYVVWTLIKHRKQDSFSDNGFFIVGLPVFLLAKNLAVNPDTWTLGVTLALGLYRLAFAVMFERTMTQFMKNAHGLELPRRRALDLSIKGSLLVAAFDPLLPAPVATAMLGLAALLLLARLLTWSPLAGLRRFEIGIMYVGYFGLVLHLALATLRRAELQVGVGQLATHVFALLCMGLVIPSMLLRISQGHTGRKLVFTRADRVAIGVMMGAAALFRLVATQYWPAHYTTWIALTAIGFSLCFALIGLRITPYLWQARVDGREH